MYGNALGTMSSREIHGKDTRMLFELVVGVRGVNVVDGDTNLNAVCDL